MYALHQVLDLILLLVIATILGVACLKGSKIVKKEEKERLDKEAFERGLKLQELNDRREKEESDRRQRSLETALRGAAHDLARHKAGLEALGFEEVQSIQQFLDPELVSKMTPAPQEEDPEIPAGEVHALVPERVLTVQIVRGVTGIVSFYADAPVALRRIRFAQPSRFGLTAAEYVAGDFDPTGMSDGEIMANAKEVLPSVFMSIVTDPACEEALRVRAAS